MKRLFSLLTAFALAASLAAGPIAPSAAALIVAGCILTISSFIFSSGISTTPLAAPSLTSEISSMNSSLLSSLAF